MNEKEHEFWNDTIKFILVLVLLAVIFGIGFSAQHEGLEIGRDYVANEWCMAEGHERGSYDQELGLPVCASALKIEK